MHVLGSDRIIPNLLDKSTHKSNTDESKLRLILCNA